MKLIKEIGREMWAIFMEGDKSHLATLSDKQTSKEHDEHVTVYTDDERRELVSVVLKRWGEYIFNRTMFGEDRTPSVSWIEEFIEEQGL